jgi:hypothetical protein
MTIRYGANGMPMAEKKKEEKPEALQEILEVNPNTVEEVEEDLSSEWIAEEEEEEDEDL